LIFRCDLAPQFIKRDLASKSKYTAKENEKANCGPRNATAGRFTTAKIIPHAAQPGEWTIAW
jgi:hypothetical protein